MTDESESPSGPPLPPGSRSPSDSPSPGSPPPHPPDKPSSGSSGGSGRLAGQVRALAGRALAQLAVGDPPLAWTLRGYQLGSLRFDGVAGLTVAALGIPLSIGYAQVAGLPPEAGLYASIVPLLAYAIFGSSRNLVVAPDAATAALIGATIAPLAVSSDQRLALASGLALLVALVFLGMRLASLGFLADFLSKPILVGYMTGVGISVALGQIPKILGTDPMAAVVDVLQGTDVLQVGLAVTFESIAIALSQIAISWPSVVVGVVVLAAILVGDRLLPGVPVALPALVVALIASAVLDLASRGVEVLGPVPSGLPPIALPLISLEQVVALLPGALAIAILSFADTSATGRAFTKDPREEPDSNRELLALSAADLGASLTSGYPISSSPSRTSASIAAGARTQMTGIVAAGAVCLVLIFLTGPMALLPIPALGAVILAAVVRMISLDRIVRIWRVSVIEGAIAVTTLLGVILYGTLVGVGVAVLLASFNVFRRAARPRIAELGMLPGTDVFADLERDRAASRVPGVAVVRFSGPLFFATAAALRTRVRSLVDGRPDARAVVIDASSMVDLDLTAAGILDQLSRELEEQGIELTVARPTGTLRDLLRQFGLAKLVGADGHVRRRIIEAVRDADAAAQGTPGTARMLAAAEVAGATDELRVREVMPIAATEGTEAEGAVEAVEAGEAEEAEQAKEAKEAKEAVTAALAVPEPLRRHWTAGIVVVGGIAILAVLAIGVLTSLGKTAPEAPAGEAVVPNLVGMPLERARTTTENRGLVLGDPVFVQTTAQPEGTVVGQSPGPGQIVPSGSAVTPRVSTGRELVVIPDVAGSTEAEAVVTLATAGLRVAGSTRIEDYVVPAGSVIATSPPAGLQVASGTSVTLIISSGPPAAATPQPGASPTATAQPSPSPTQTPALTPPPTTVPSPEPTPAPTPPPTAPVSPQPTSAPAMPTATPPVP